MPLLLTALSLYLLWGGGAALARSSATRPFLTAPSFYSFTSFSSSSSLAVASPAEAAAGAAARPSTIANLEAVDALSNSTLPVAALPEGVVVSNGGGGVFGNADGADMYALVTSQLAAPGVVTYEALSVDLSSGGVVDRFLIPEVRFVLWDGFGIRAAVDQRAPSSPVLAVLAPTSNISNPGEPTQRYDMGVFVVDFSSGTVAPVLALQGNPISAGGASAFDSARGNFWFVLGDLNLVQRIFALDTTSSELVINSTLIRPPGLTLLAWDSLTRDMFGVGVTPQPYPQASRFEVVRLDAESGEVVQSFSLDAQAAAGGWRNVRVSNVALNAATRTLYFLTSGRPPLMPLNWLTLVAVNIETGSVQSISSYCHTGSPREGVRNCPLIIGQACSTGLH
jgi:hypothetical protein